jgi:hypothetical protein
MVKRIAWLAALILLPDVARSAPETPPEQIFGIYANRVEVCPSSIGCEGQTLNYVLVAPRPNRRVGVQIGLVFSAGHSCGLDENGEWDRDRVVVRMFYQDQGEKECRLELFFKGNNVILNDVGDRCRVSTCGTRGSYTGMELPRKGSF